MNFNEFHRCSLIFIDFHPFHVAQAPLENLEAQAACSQKAVARPSLVALVREPQAVLEACVRDGLARDIRWRPLQVAKQG